MVRNILTIAAITIASLTGLVAGQQYEDFFLDTTVGHTFADPLSSLEFVVGTLALTKAYCDGIPACIAILYQDSVPGGTLLQYDPNGDTGAQAGFTSVSWKYDATVGPSCRSATDVITDASGFCLCDPFLETQNTNFGCVARLIPSGVVERRSRKMARNQITPGRPATPLF